MKVGVLALQGDVREHVEALSDLGVTATLVKLPRDLEGVRGIIIPGGESTTIGKLMETYDLIEPLRDRILAGTMAAWGTCAGMILLSRDTGDQTQPLLRVMDIGVQRNAFGSQVDSFEADVPIQGIAGGPFPAVFIRAPVVSAVGPSVEVLGRLPSDESVVAIRQEAMFATSLSP